MRIIVAVTGASGAIYARKVVEELLKCPSVERIGLIVSRNGAAVAQYEGVSLEFDDARIERFDNDDMFSSVASGSARWGAMIIVPCSMGSVGRIASGVSTDLISRAADVVLKERRKLIVVPRESPLSLIHLRNLTTLTEAGAVVLPASPSFYSLPQNIDELTDTIVERIVSQLGIENNRFEWK